MVETCRTDPMVLHCGEAVSFGMHWPCNVLLATENEGRMKVNSNDSAVARDSVVRPLDAGLVENMDSVLEESAHCSKLRREDQGPCLDFAGAPDVDRDPYFEPASLEIPDMNLMALRDRNAVALRTVTRSSGAMNYDGPYLHIKISVLSSLVCCSCETCTSKLHMGRSYSSSSVLPFHDEHLYGFMKHRPDTCCWKKRIDR